MIDYTKVEKYVKSKDGLVQFIPTLKYVEEVDDIEIVKLTEVYQCFDVRKADEIINEVKNRNEFVSLKKKSKEDKDGNWTFTITAKFEIQDL